MSTLKQKIKQQQSLAFWQFVLDNPDKRWNYRLLSVNPNITWEVI